MNVLGPARAARSSVRHGCSYGAGLSAVAFRRMRGRHLTGLLTAVAFVAVTAPAQAVTSDFSLPFGSHALGSATTADIHIVYRDPKDADAKPSPIRHLVIELPPGTRIGLATVPACTASNEELQATGPSACPPESQVGDGTLIAITGFGPPADPFTGKATVFNTGEGIVEVIQDPQSGGVIAVDRIMAKGSTLTGNPPSTPGGPPDGQTSVRQIDFHFPAETGYFKTPTACPSSGNWLSSAAFTFADATTQNVSSTTPCDRPATPPTPGTTPPGAQRCVVPKLAGKKLSAARRALAKAHCKVGRVTRKKGKKANRGRVLSTSPKAGTVKPAGAKVGLVVGK